MLMTKERALALWEVYISHHPEGTEEDFYKRLDWVVEMEERAMDSLKNGNPLLSIFLKKGKKK